MEWLLLAVVVGGGGWAAKKWRDRLALRRTTADEQAAELAGVRRLADEDVTFLGEQLQCLDGEVAGHQLEALRTSTAASAGAGGGDGGGS